MPNRHTNLNFNYRSNTIKKKKKQKGELGKTKRIPFWENEQNLMKEKTNGLAGETRSY